MPIYYRDEKIIRPASTRKSDPVFGAAYVTRDQKDKGLEGIERGLLVRTGLAERPAGGEQFANFSLKEMARECLRISGQIPPARSLEMIGRAFTTSDFGNVLANVTNKALFEGFEQANETYPAWCDTSGIVSDFREQTLAKISESDDLEEVAEEEEYHYGSRSDSKETFQLATFGRLFRISRQAIINDDLNALTGIPRSHGEAAARKIGDVVYSVLTANETLNDGVALFNAATHGNYVAVASGAAPGTATIGAGILAMKSQTDLKGLRKLNIRPEYFIAPVALEGAAEVFFRSERFTDTDTIATDSTPASTRVNPYAGSYFTRVYDPRLDDDSATAWYLAGPKGKTVKLYFLDGEKAPFIEMRDSWTVDGLETKVRIDAVAKAVDYRGLYCNEGT